MIRVCEVSRMCFTRGDAVGLAARLVVAAHERGQDPGFITVAEKRVPGWPTMFQVVAPDLVLSDEMQALAPGLLAHPQCRDVKAIERAISKGNTRFPLLSLFA